MAPVDVIDQFNEGMGSSVKIDPQYDGIVMLSPEIIYFNDAQPRPDGRKVYHVFENNDGLNLPDEISDSIDYEDFELNKTELFSKASEDSLENIKQVLAENGIQIQNWPNIPNGSLSLVSVKSPQTLLANLSILALDSSDPTSYCNGVANGNNGFASSCSDNGEDSLVDDPSSLSYTKNESVENDSSLDRRKSHRLTTYHKVSAKNEKKRIEKIPYSLESDRMDFQTSNNYFESTDVCHSLIPTSLSLLDSADEDKNCYICNQLIKVHCFESHVKMHLKDNCNVNDQLSYQHEKNATDFDLLKGSLSVGISPLKCIFCSFDTDSLDTLYKHMETSHNILDYKVQSGAFKMNDGNGNESNYDHNKDELFKCDMCGFQSKYYNNLKVHIKRHNGEKPYSCPHCPYRTDRSSTLRHHLESHVRKPKVTSNKDEIDYQNFVSLKQENFDFSEKHKCSLCNYETDIRKEMKQHARVHSERNIIICKYCSFSCWSKVDLKIHVNSLHTPDKGKNISTDKNPQNFQFFRCSWPMCDFSTKYHSNLNTHEKRHNGHRRHMCSYCDFKCDVSITFKNHMLQHNASNTTTEEQKLDFGNNSSIRKVNIKQEIFNIPKKFHCPFCKFSSDTKFNLAIHSKTHSEKLPLECVLCEFVADNIVNLKNHIKSMHVMHLGNKTPNNIKSEGDSLSLHVPKHSGEDLHLCPYCQYQGHDLVDLKNHLDKHSENFDYHSANAEESSMGNDLFRCSMCCYTSTTKSELDMHGFSHLCKFCNFCCDEPIDMEMHINTEHEEHPKSSISSNKDNMKGTYVAIQQGGVTILQCNVCGYKTKQSNYIKMHMSSHSGEKPFSCSQCDYRTAFSSNLIVHSKTHLPKLKIPIEKEVLPDFTLFRNETLKLNDLNTEPVNCNIRSFSTAAKPELNEPIETHNEIATFNDLVTQLHSHSQCPDEVMISSDEKLDNVTPNENEEQLFSCYSCNFVTKNLHQFEIHLKSHEQKTLDCSHCEFKTLDEKKFKLHLKVHDGKKIYSCSECEFKTTLPNGLNKHMTNIHFGGKTLFCTSCDFNTVDRKNFKKHLQMHQTKPLHKCSFCNHQTVNKSSLIVHIRIHTGEKPFNCDMCDYKCNQNSSLKAHKNMHHRV